MIESATSAIVNLPTLMAILNMFHIFGAVPAARLPIVETRAEKVRIVFSLLGGTLILSCITSPSAGIATYVITHSEKYAFLATALSAAVTFTASFAGYFKCATYARTVNTYKETWKSLDGDQFEIYLPRLVHGIYSTYGLLLSLLISFIQLAALVAFARAPGQSRVLDIANTDHFTQSSRAMLATMALFCVGTYVFVRFMSPSQILVESVFRYYSTIHIRPVSRLSIGISRWRTEHHRLAFRTADSLIRSLSGLKKKLTLDDFNHVESTYRAVAHALRQQSVKIDVSKFNERYAELCYAATSLAVESNPMVACRKARDIVGQDATEEPSRSSLASRWLSSIDGTLQRYSRILMILIGSIVVISLIASGQFGKTVEFLQQVVAPK